MGSRTGLAEGVLVLCLVIGLLIVPFVSVMDWQFGGGYTHENYPLDQANDYLQQGLAYIPYNPSGIVTTTYQAWNLTNASESAVGTNSPCWLWAKPTQTYSYVDEYYANVIASTESWVSTANSSGYGGIFHNTSSSNWGQIGAAIEQAQAALKNIQGCNFYGNVVSIEETLADLGWLTIGTFGMTVLAMKFE